MRTRQRNRRAASPARDVQMQEGGLSEDDDAAAAPLSGPEDGNASAEGGSSDEGSEYSNDSVAAGTRGDGAQRRPQRRRKRQQQQQQSGGTPPGADRDGEDDPGLCPEPPPDIYKIPPYPSESRNTRVYAGPLKKWNRFRSLIEVLYGSDQASIRIINGLRWHWDAFPVLPRKTIRSGDYEDDEEGASDDDEPGGVLPSPWLPENFEREQIRACRDWYEHLYRQPDASGLGYYDESGQQQQRQKTTLVSAADAQPCLPQSAGSLVALVGPSGRQQAVHFRPGESLAFGASGLPASQEETASREAPAGWMFDVGGIVVSMDWAPLVGHVDQLLALAVLPFSDQEQHQQQHHTTAAAEPDEQGYDASKKMGSLQFWRVSLGRSHRRRRDADEADSLLLPPCLERVLCFDWGRPKRVRWCPVPLVTDASSVYGLVAVLTGDGLVRVVEVEKSTATEYHWVEQPVATLGRLDEYNISVTCLTWLGTNRIALGHSDGSITVWSVDPALVLQRHAVQPSHVLEMCSGYPSYPYMVALYPLGGVARLVDLARPSTEHTFHTSPVIAFQPGLLRWCDHMQGFAGAGPSNNPLSANLHFMHVRFYATSRTLFPGRGLAPPVCLSVGSAHPYMLVGRADGSLWAGSMIGKAFRNRHDVAHRLKVFEGEFRPQPPGTQDDLDGGPVRGAVRILQGFLPERNEMPRRGGVAPAQKKAKGKPDEDEDAPSESTEGEGEGEGDDDDNDDADDDNAPDAARSGGGGPSQTVIHEPLTRVSAAAWNPNIEYGWWAAAAMASGLVRVMDLGVEPRQ